MHRQRPTHLKARLEILRFAAHLKQIRPQRVVRADGQKRYNAANRNSMQAVFVSDGGMYAHRKRIQKLVWGLSAKVDWKQVVVGCALMCISLSVVAAVMIQSAIADVPLKGSNLVVIFVCFVGALSGFMIMHRGTERAWL